MGEQESSKWEGEITQELRLTPEQVWPLIADFCSLDKWFFHVDKCYLVEGVQGEPGMIRCCESSQFSGGGLQWAKEKLLMIDPSQMCLSYEITDNNAGFKSYVATFRLFPIDHRHDNDDGRDGESRCKFVWSFVADPVEGFTLQGLLELFNAIAATMVKRMEDAFSQPQESLN